MTAEELYKMAKTLMFEKSTSKDYDNYYIGNINIILVECFDLNNDIRISRGVSPLKNIPFVMKKDDVIPYEEVVCNEILPQGLASRFLMDDDLAKFNIFTVYYENAKAKHSKIIEKEIVDVYA